jgi:hypothetical protein
VQANTCTIVFAIIGVALRGAAGRNYALLVASFAIPCAFLIHGTVLTALLVDTGVFVASSEQILEAACGIGIVCRLAAELVT